ncbi:MAG: hypothetical protein V4641_05700 [Pseudomonadota bacterium]
MNRPQWVQDDIKTIWKWWSTRFMALGFLFSAIGTGAIYSVNGVYFKDWLGRMTLPVCAALFTCGFASHFVRQRKARKARKADSAQDDAAGNGDAEASE